MMLSSQTDVKNIIVLKHSIKRDGMQFSIVFVKSRIIKKLKQIFTKVKKVEKVFSAFKRIVIKIKR